MQELLSAEATRPFNLAGDLMLRASVVRVEAREHLLLLSVHHLAADVWSLDILYRELAALYPAALAAQPCPLPELRVQYGQFAAAQRRAAEGDGQKEHLLYWKEQLAGEWPPLALSTQSAASLSPSFRGARQTIALPASLSASLKELSRAEDSTLYVTLLTAFQTLLHRYSGQERILVGSPIGARQQSDAESLIGLFLNMVVLPASFAGNPSFREMMGRVRRAVFGAFAHQAVPLERLVEELKISRVPGRNPLFQTVFQFLAAPMANPELAGLRVTPLPMETGTAKFDLTLTLAESADGLAGDLEYNTDIFDSSFIARLLEHFQTLLEGIASDPDQLIGSFALVTRAEKCRLLAKANSPATPYPRNFSIGALFEKQASATPEAVALSFQGCQMTYGELEARSNQLARHLGARGVGPDVLVGVCLERSMDLVVTLLAVLKAGGAYVPLDPAYPAERLAFMLADTAAPVIVTTGELAQKIFSEYRGTIVAVDRDAEQIGSLESTPLPAAAGPENLAYVIYTSGSTGQPKGVAVEQRAVGRLVKNTNYIAFDSSDVFLLFAPISFDASTFEIWGALLNGARLVISPPRLKSLEDLAESLQREGITTLWLTAGLFHQMVDHHLDSLKGLRCLLAGGDVLSVPHVLKAARELPETQLINGYGPTENTTFTCCFAVPHNWTGAPSVPIGQPISNTQVYILDQYRQLVPFGLTGELYIGGDGLARGYLNAPELTAQKFVPNPLEPQGGARLYRTGDLVRWLPDGNMAFLGRVDQQLKIRGFRVEPGEIEQVLNSHVAVKQAVVSACADSSGSKFLVAHVALRPGARADARALRTYLENKLPRHLVPSQFVFLESFPLTANGKIDRAALPAPQDAGSAGDAPPRSPEEQILAQVWSELLGGRTVGVHDNFFECGGHSLLAMRLISRLSKDCQATLTLRDIFEHPTLAALAEVLARAKGSAGQSPPIAPADALEPEAVLPLSFAQQRLWFVDQLQPGSPLYNVPLAYRLEGPLDVEALLKSLRSIVERHEVLRTVYLSTNGAPGQKIASSFALDPPVIDLGEGPESRAQLSKLLEQAACRPFNLELDLMMRAALFKLGESQHVLFLNFHHIAFDEWSQGIFEAELAQLYAAFREGRTPELSPLPVQYADFACWQQEQSASGAFAADLDFWTSHLAGAEIGLETPADRPHPAARLTEGRLETRVLGEKLAGALKALCQRQGTTPYLLLLTALNTLLSRYASREELIIAAPTAGRTPFETQSLIGFFVNMLALRIDLSGDPTFLELLERVRQVNLKALDHQHAPFEKVVERLQPARNPQHPLFAVAFALQNYSSGLRLADLAATALPVHTGTAKFDLTFVARDQGGELALLLEYNTSLFAPETARRMLEHFETLLQSIVTDPAGKISQLALLTERERAQVVEEWNRTAAEYPRAQTVPRLFEEQAARTPEAAALTYGQRSLTYKELNARANQLAHYLRKAGIGPGVPVGTFLERSPELIVAWLGILKAGGAYVPLDLEYPPERLSFVMADTQMHILLSREGLVPQIPSGAARVLALEAAAAQIAVESAENPSPSEVSADGLAYIISTSGSTGQPKGVAVAHRGIVRLLFGADYVQLDAACRLAQASNSAFDAATFEVWGALLHGGTLVGVQKETILSPPEFAAFLERERITTLFLTTALFNQMAAEAPTAFAPLRDVLFGGEACDPRAVEQILKHGAPRRLLHVYGPTESTTFASWYEVKSVPPDARTLPIGRPLSNTTLYVLDARRQPVPIGVPGELYIGGDGLACGYYRRPELTAERFIDNPLGPGRLYKTGDLARRLADGNIEFIGRIDSQVKLRGFRIELGEIEAVLNRAPGVRESIVLLREDSPGEKLLSAYFLAQEGASPTPAQLRAFLKEKLPSYMVPATFQQLTSFPVNANGKINRRALPRPGTDGGEKAHFPPRTELEIQLHEVWQSVLGHSDFGIRDDFFEIGGHSLLAVRLILKTESAIGIKLPMPILFQAATIEKLAEALSHNAPFTPGSCLVKIQPAGSRPPIFWPHTLGGGAGGGLFTYRKLAQLLGPDQPSYGFVAPARPFTTIETMAAHYIQEMKRVQPLGPYYLGGYCFAGVVAYEMARQLEEAGEKVALLVLLDSSPPDLTGECTRPSFKLVLHFLRTLPSWASDLLSQDRGELKKTLQWKAAVWRQKLRRSFHVAGAAKTAKLGPETLHELVDMSAYPPEYRRFAEVHWNALIHYSPRPFRGRAVLFKGEDRYLLRLDGEESWRKLVLGGIEVRQTIGRHDGILAEPCVRVLAARLNDCLRRAHRAES